MELGGGGIVENKQVILKGFVDERVPTENDMEIKIGKVNLHLDLDINKKGFIVVKNLYLSCDPYMRGRMRDFRGSYLPPFVPGQPLEGFGVAKVVSSSNPDFQPGDFISGFTGWEEYSLIRRYEQLKKIIPDDGIPLSFHLGLLGMPGFTAYAGFYEVCSPKKGEYVFVSAASGAVGQLVGQLAKLHGCHVVGSAGSSKKVDLLKNKLGFDEAFNYKDEADLEAALKRYFPQGIDIYFDNVGGDMLDAVLGNMRAFGRIAACGMVSLSSLSGPQTMSNLFNIVIKRIRMQGFLQSDYLHLFPRFVEEVTSYYKQGKIVYLEDMSEGLESAPSALVGLYSGKNIGPVLAFPNSTAMTGGYANNPGVCGALLRSCPVIMQKKCRGGGLAAVATGAVILTTIVVPIVLYYLLPRVTRKEEDDPEGNKWAKSIKTKGIKVLVFEKWLLKMRFGDLMKTTNNFRTNNIIGDSRTGTTYRAMLPDAQFLMVKRLQDSQHLEKEFASEMNALRSLKHCNLFSSITFLRGGKGKVLVYEYMEHGTLYGQFQTLESEAASRTDWPSRLRIAIEAAKGLAWLHHNRNPRIIPSIRTSAPNACS